MGESLSERMRKLKDQQAAQKAPEIPIPPPFIPPQPTTQPLKQPVKIKKSSKAKLKEEPKSESKQDHFVNDGRLDLLTQQLAELKQQFERHLIAFQPVNNPLEKTIDRPDIIAHIIAYGKQSPLPEYQYIAKVLQRNDKNADFQRKKILDFLAMALDLFTIHEKSEPRGSS